jgi:hypothetical protein
MIFHSSWVSFCYSSLPVRRNYGLLRLTIQSPESTVATSKQLPADGGKFVEEVFEFAGNVEKGAITVDPCWREDHCLPQSKQITLASDTVILSKIVLYEPLIKAGKASKP